jgi:hypothetical protein
MSGVIQDSRTGKLPPSDRGYVLIHHLSDTVGMWRSACVTTLVLINKVKQRLSFVVNTEMGDCLGIPQPPSS